MQSAVKSGVYGECRTHTDGFVNGLCMDLEPCMVRQHRIDLIWPEPACSRLHHQLVKVQVCPPIANETHTSNNSVQEAAQNLLIWTLNSTRLERHVIEHRNGTTSNKV